MKKYIIILTLISSIVSYAQKITRGPDIGEIYFLGPTNTGIGLYHSLDFGLSSICVDNTITTNVMTITADKAPGVVYYVTMQEGLYRSDNYGNQNSWNLVSGNTYIYLKSGVNEGFIYNAIVSHSEDFGNNFTPHAYNGFFGNLSAIEIDNEPSVGYAILSQSSVPDSIYLMITYDNYENLSIHNIFNKYDNPIGRLTRGDVFGELFTFVYYPSNIKTELKHSFDYGYTWTIVNELNFSEPYSLSLEGGRQTGEVYILYNFINMAWQNAHIYIYHSTDYGITFEVFHPFSKGNEPVLANFSSIEKEVLLTVPIEFSNFSIGNIIEYQWDFENDGIIDSYDDFPTHIYQDTGYYSVKLSVVGQDSTNSFLKENYIHVIDTITSNPDLNYQNLKIFPNPFNEKISIESRPEFKMIEIYDLNGKRHYTKALLHENKTEIIDLKKLEKGIYILKIKTEGQDLTKKIIKI